MSFNPLNYPLCLIKPRRTTDVTAWDMHIPFAFTVVQMLKPKIFVELGTHKGNSYCAFCQAVDQLGLNTACYAIDTWEGDEQSGFYSREVLDELRNYHDALYGGFSQLIQSRFDQMLDYFSDGSIDLLHIDGLHTYDAVKHDFENWLPKMSKQGIILFHDINVRERGFGVWLLWEELNVRYPSFEFKHGNGLGVLAIGTAIPQEVLAFFDTTKEDKDTISKFFSYLGSKIHLENQLQRKDVEGKKIVNALQTRDARIHSLETSLLEKNAQVDEITTALQTKDARIHSLETSLLEKNAQVIELKNTLESIQRSMIWQLVMKFHNSFIERALHPGSRRRRWYDSGLNCGRNFLHGGYRSWFTLKNKKKNTAHIAENKKKIETKHISLSDFSEKTYRASFVKKHENTVDIIICVHNAFADVKKCLESVINHTKSPFSLILVDDGSADPTKSYLEDFAKRHNIQLIRNMIAKGYTIACNQGLKLSTADYVVLLNSDTIVASEWLDRMIECAESDDSVGIVGPLSNTASWQSVPEIEGNGDWAANILPPDISVEQMAGLIARYSGRLYPEIPFLNGFCLLIKRELISEIGYFDEECFGKGYGEENDYCIRARNSQWDLRVADDVYIYHAQSRSYSNETRKELCKRANEALIKKHGQTIITEGVFKCQYNRTLEGIRARTQALFSRLQLICEGNNRWAGKQILILLPVTNPGGGAYVVIQESRAMLEMGVHVCLMNLKIYKEKFECNYPDLELPVIYSQPDEIGIIAKKYDAVIATHNSSVEWLESIIQKQGMPVRGYYVQDFEPNFCLEGSNEFTIALESYTKFPNLVRITKTKWNEEIVKEKIGVNCQVIGPSVDIDLFRPKQRYENDPQNRPICISAMIRPSTPRRGSLLTMNVLREIWMHHKNNVKIITFGCDKNELDTLHFSKDFNFDHLEIISSRKELAILLNEIDIFVDFSSYQAMGLTALEAMACGASVIVPQAGGSKEFVNHGHNGFVVDTSSEKACFEALNRLVTDDELRIKMGRQALKDACQYPPEKAAYNILLEIFKQSKNYDLLSDREDLIPPEELIFIGPGDFKQIGDEFLKYFIDLGNLKPTEQVLDVGCGIGRMAIPLTRYLDKNGSYEGFDIVLIGIDWCKKNISTRHPNFHFQLAEVYNKFYNQDGKFKASEYKFPFKNESFDFIFLTSVFTHMLPEDLENYFSEIARVMKKGGRCLITFFLLNEESQRLIKAKKSSQDFKFKFKGYSTVDENNPEGAVAYEEKTIRMLFEKYGFEINNPIHFGSWCGRQNFLSYQDIIVAVKGGSPEEPYPVRIMGL